MELLTFPHLDSVIMHVALLLYCTQTALLSALLEQVLLHDCPWLRVNKPWPHTHTTPPLPPSVCSVVSNRSTGRQHSAALVLSSARGPNNIEFSSAGIHKHTVSIILPQAQHHISHHNQIFVPAVRDAIKFCQVRRAGTRPASH